MTLLFKDYIDLVVKAYEERRDANHLSHLLMHPTTTNIRQECFDVYTERIKKGEREEENTLRAFFGVPPPGKNFGQIIGKHELDRFRPLRNLIKGEIKNPALVNVELLAWLLDFTPRPLANAQRILGNTDKTNIPVNQITGGSKEKPNADLVEKNAEEIKEVLPSTNTVNTENLLQDGEDETSITGNKDASKLSTKNSKGSSPNSRLKIAASIVLIIIILFGGMYMQQHEKSGEIVFGNVNTACMYWADDHYERVPCNSEPKGRLILPLNEEKIKNFQRITKEDTITEKSIGVIYCISVNGKIEYFTTGGNHPVYVTRPLKLLSRYMFENHLRKETLGKDSLDEQNMKDINKR